MVFSSIIFLFAFLPATYILYSVLPGLKLKNFVLIFASLVFYAWGEGKYVLLMIASVLINWCIGLLINRFYEKKKLFVFISVLLNIGMLFIFKYLNFFCSVFSSITRISIAEFDVHLPIGISFFTFQILSYVIDVSRNKEIVQKNFFDLLLYISLFPQLIAGPIVKYHDISNQINNRKLSWENTAAGIRRFIIGLSKKIIIADTVAKVSDMVFDSGMSEITCLAAWIGAVCYTIQIYFDFSGYSDMAIGLGKMFGFEFKENFLHPYMSKSIKEFWNRWHISLSTWFKEYLYIPLGGNRKGKLRTCVNLFIVFLATGLWHGAQMTFVIWGVYNGCLVILERIGVIPINKIKPGFVKRIYSILMIVIGFTIFRAETVSCAFSMIKKMFSLHLLSDGLGSFSTAISWYVIFIIAVAIIACTPVVPKIKAFLSEKGTKIETVVNISGYIASFLLYIICFLIMASNSYSPFIYFRF